MDLFSGTLGVSAPFHTLREGQVRPPAGLQAAGSNVPGIRHRREPKSSMALALGAPGWA